VEPLRINLFTLGDCTDINTWSSLPYFFYRNLRKRCFVRPVDMIRLESVSYAAVRPLAAFRARTIQLIAPNYRYEPYRTRLYRAFANHHLRYIARQYNDVDMNLFLTFSLSTHGFVDVPVVHFCDQTYEEYVERNGWKPTRRDRALMKIDQCNIENADLVLATSQLCCDFIKQRYKPKRAFCLRTGPNIDADVPNPEDLIAVKEHSTDILFIGRGAYSRGADVLIHAFKIFNQRHGSRFTLHIVGVWPNELPAELQVDHPRIRFHGYLDRNKPADLQLYDSLLRSARMFVMPMRMGPFPGVIREAQLYCTPVIASKVSSNGEQLTDNCDSVLVDSLEPPEYANQMDLLIQDVPRWRQFARNAHTKRKNHTWTNTAEDFLYIIRESNLLQRRRF
jgi:glycosyltransferase involved in cell wall biosynthesis